MTDKIHKVEITGHELMAFKSAVNTLNLISLYYNIPELDIKAEYIEKHCDTFLERNRKRPRIK